MREESHRILKPEGGTGRTGDKTGRSSVLDGL